MFLLFSFTYEKEIFELSALSCSCKMAAGFSFMESPNPKRQFSLPEFMLKPLQRLTLVPYLVIHNTSNGFRKRQGAKGC